MRTIFVAIGLVGCIAAVSPAQASPDTFLYFSFAPTTPPTLYEISASGTLVGTIATFPPGFQPYRVEMAEDNRDYRVTGDDGPPNYRGVLLNVTPAGIVTTIHCGAPLNLPWHMIRTCDGDWFVINSPDFTGTTVLRLTGTSLSTLTKLSATWAFGVTENPENDALIVRAGTTLGSYVTGYFHLDLRTGAIASILIRPPTVPTPVQEGSKRPAYDPPTGDLHDMTVDTSRNSHLVRLHPSTGLTTLSSLIGRLAADLVAVGGRTRGYDFHAFVTPSWPPPGPIEIIQFRKDGTIAGKSIVPMSTPRYNPGKGILRKGSRHLCWYMNQAPNGRKLQLSFPGEAGRAYAVGFSVSGIRPGIPLPDGRVVSIVPDALTAASLTGGIPGVLDRTVGTLDARGKATVNVDTNRFGSALKSLRLWAAAVVLDPQAPSGVAQVVGPTVLTIRR